MLQAVPLGENGSFLRLNESELTGSDQDECEAFLLNVTKEIEKYITFVFEHLRKGHMMLQRSGWTILRQNLILPWQVNA